MNNYVRKTFYVIFLRAAVARLKPLDFGMTLRWVFDHSDSWVWIELNNLRRITIKNLFNYIEWCSRTLMKRGNSIKEFSSKLTHFFNLDHFKLSKLGFLILKQSSLQKGMSKSTQESFIKSAKGENGLNSSSHLMVKNLYHYSFEIF